MTEKLLSIPFSLLILKPEFMLLPEQDRDRIWQNLGTVVGPNLLESHTVRMQRAQAVTIWKNIAAYSWSNNYYDFMTDKDVSVLAIQGENKALQVKTELRSIFAPEINHLTAIVGGGYSADIFHGSDAGNQLLEAKTLGIL